MAKDLFDLGHMVYLHRIKFNRREAAPQPNLQSTKDPHLRIFWSVVARNIDRARRRWQRAIFCPLSEVQGPLTMADGSVDQDHWGG